MTNADCIRRMSDEQLYEFLSEWECGDIDYSITFCDLCKQDGNELNLDCDGCRKHWLQRDAVEYGGLMYWKRNTVFDTADRKDESSSEKPNNSTISKMEQVDKDDAYFLELMGAVERGEISDAGANQAWYEYINHKDEPQTEQWHYDEQDNTWYPYQHKSCATCKHALGNWDGESNNCGRCCGADRRFYESIEDEPQYDAEEVAKDINRRVEMGKKEVERQTDCAWK